MQNASLEEEPQEEPDLNLRLGATEGGKEADWHHIFLIMVTGIFNKPVTEVREILPPTPEDTCADLAATVRKWPAIQERFEDSRMMPAKKNTADASEKEAKERYETEVGARQSFLALEVKQSLATIKLAVLTTGWMKGSEEFEKSKENPKRVITITAKCINSLNRARQANGERQSKTQTRNDRVPTLGEKDTKKIATRQDLEPLRTHSSCSMHYSFA